MIVISDASILINLAIIKHLELLKALYGKVVIPDAVFNEIVVKGAGKPGAQEIPMLDWIEVKSCQDVNMVNNLLNEIDLGEAEAITLSVEIQANLLLIDEKLGRLKAKEFNVKTIGLLGILLDAKYQGVVSNVTQMMDRLRLEANFRIGETLYQQVKQLAGE